MTVRVIKLKQKSLPQSLAQQMEVLSKLRHMHLVSVLGHSIASNQDHNQHAGHTIFIVQEYISSGSLRDFLTSNNNLKKIRIYIQVSIDSNGYSLWEFL